MIDQLLGLAEIWCRAADRSRARLSTVVINDGKFFDKIELRGAGCTVATFEKFLSFFRDGANWPEGRIPLAACDLLDNFSNIATEAENSPGKSSDLAAASPVPTGDARPNSASAAAGETGVDGTASAPVERGMGRAA